MEIKIGCDPELFLKKGDQFRSGYGIVPGTKADPYKVKGGAVQLDGLAAEFNIDPASSKPEFISNINTVLAELRGMVPEDHVLDFSPVAHFEPGHMAEQPDHVKVLGCDPDFNAYTLKANDPPDAAMNMRTAAGHIHIGWQDDGNPEDELHLQACATLVKQLDFALGVPSVIHDPDVQRRAMYGRAGCFRPKSYGVEYRVLSNFWVQTEEMMAWAYDTTMNAVEDLMSGVKLFEQVTERELQRIINTSDVHAARNLMGV